MQCEQCSAFEEKISSLEDELENKVAALETKKAQITHLLEREGKRPVNFLTIIVINRLFCFIVNFARFTHVKLMIV